MIIYQKTEGIRMNIKFAMTLSINLAIYYLGFPVEDSNKMLNLGFYSPPAS